MLTPLRDRFTGGTWPYRNVLYKIAFDPSLGYSYWFGGYISCAVGQYHVEHTDRGLKQGLPVSYYNKTVRNY